MSIKIKKRKLLKKKNEEKELLDGKPEEKEPLNIKTEVRNWLYQHEWDIAATMTFANELSQQSADRAIKRFWKRVDWQLYRNAARKYNKRCERINVREGSEYGTRYHFHSLIKRPKDRYETDDGFCQFLKEQWLIENSNNFIIDFQPLCTGGGWTNYITKAVSHNDCDTIELNSSHISAAN